MIYSRSGDKCLTLPKYALNETLDRPSQHALFLNPPCFVDPNTKVASPRFCALALGFEPIRSTRQSFTLVEIPATGYYSSFIELT